MCFLDGSLLTTKAQLREWYQQKTQIGDMELKCYQCYLYILSYSCSPAFNDCYSELMPYTALVICYRVSAYDMYQFQGPRPLTITTTVAM